MREFSLLVEEVALGDEQNPVFPRERFERLARLRERLDGMREHLAAGLEILPMTSAGTRPSVTSIAVSIIESVNPLMPKP